MDIALKVFKLSLFGFERQDNQKEGKILQFLKPNENVISLIEIISINTETYLIFPLMKQSLYDEIYDPEYVYSEERARAVTAMILNGIAHIHHHNIIHRDLKPDNILMDANGQPQIADFGFSKIFKPNEYFMEAYGTKPYMAPELFLKYGYNEKCDIWVSNWLNIFKLFFHTL